MEALSLSTAEFAGCRAALGKSIGVARTADVDAMSATLLGRIRCSLFSGRGSARSAGLNRAGFEIVTALGIA